MCIEMVGEVRSSRTVKTKKGGDLEILNVLVNFGKYERIEQVANFSKSVIPVGKCRLAVVPKVNVSGDRGFLNWSTFDGMVK